MARYGHIELSARLLPVDLESQLVPGTFAHVRIAQKRIDEAAVLVADVREKSATLGTKSSDVEGELSYLEGRIKLARGDATGAKASLRLGIDLLEEQNPSDYWLVREAKAALGQAESQAQKGVARRP